MPKHVLTIACACLLTVQTGTSLAVGRPVCEGIVLEVTVDTIKIEEWGKTYTFLMSDDLQTNTDTEPNIYSYVRLKDVKKGDKVGVKYDSQDGHLIFIGINRRAPDDTGIVTEVGKDTIAIRNDMGMTTTYKVNEKLVNNAYPASLYSPVYPSRFSEVAVGCRIEITCGKQDGETFIRQLDVKKEKVKDK